MTVDQAQLPAVHEVASLWSSHGSFCTQTPEGQVMPARQAISRSSQRQVSALSALQLVASACLAQLAFPAVTMYARILPLLLFCEPQLHRATARALHNRIRLVI